LILFASILFSLTVVSTIVIYRYLISMDCDLISFPFPTLTLQLFGSHSIVILFALIIYIHSFIHCMDCFIPTTSGSGSGGGGGSGSGSGGGDGGGRGGGGGGGGGRGGGGGGGGFFGIPEDR
jgi:hypothetical protein